ncbi:SCO family protein [Streptomyces xanthii]|uniref:SCO family protein n=1 Tax=Streptomyces xanthii TaxID=2768069 RepID=A0A7H1B8Z4_9ACTN|nr:SCO family protein [Streptomyces xanthii]QNS05199.1 SCO family protein [Streptomyces xanthii]
MKKTSKQSRDKKAGRKTLFAAAGLVTAAAFTLSACGTGSDDSAKPVTEVSTEAGSQKAATVLDKPFEKPDLVLTDTHGKKFDLRERTKGRPTLIYFGYTHCPDVCPLTMSNIAVAKKALPKSEQDKLQVVFVTTDPDRDTPAVLGKWLKAQDADFIGLTGDFATIQGGARTIGISIEPTQKDKNGKLVSMHGTQVIAFSPKTDAGYVLYGEDATVDDYTKDLPKIVKGAKP